MSRQFDSLLSFMEQLACSGMNHEAIAERGYEYALALYRADEDQHLPQGKTMSHLLQVYCMDHAADLLKAVVGRGIKRGTHDQTSQQ